MPNVLISQRHVCLPCCSVRPSLQQLFRGCNARCHGAQPGHFQLAHLVNQPTDPKNPLELSFNTTERHAQQHEKASAACSAVAAKLGKGDKR